MVVIARIVVYEIEKFYNLKKIGENIFKCFYLKKKNNKNKKYLN